MSISSICLEVTPSMDPPLVLDVTFLPMFETTCESFGLSYEHQVLIASAIMFEQSRLPVKWESPHFGTRHFSEIDGVPTAVEIRFAYFAEWSHLVLVDVVEGNDSPGRFEHAATGIGGLDRRLKKIEHRLRTNSKGTQNDYREGAEGSANSQ